MIWLKPTQEVVYKILERHLPEIQGRDWKDCFNDQDNLFFIKEDNLAFFEKDSEGVYTGHYFFNTIKGREAISFSKEILFSVFSLAEVVKGLTPINKKGARLMSRWLGFTSYGIIDTYAGPAELFILTKEEWSKLNG